MSLLLKIYIFGAILSTVVSSGSIGLQKFISKLRKKDDPYQTQHYDYDPKAHLYAQFLNSSFANMSVTDLTTANTTERQRQTVPLSKGIFGLLQLIPKTSTMNPTEKLFGAYLKYLYDNMTAKSVQTVKVTPSENEELIPVTCSIKPKIENNILKPKFEPESFYTTTTKTQRCRDKDAAKRIEKESSPVTCEEKTTTLKEENSFAPCEKENPSLQYKEENSFVPCVGENSFVPSEKENPPVQYEEENSFVPFVEENSFVPSEKENPPVQYEEENSFVPCEEGSSVPCEDEDLFAQSEDEDSFVPREEDEDSSLSREDEDTYVRCQEESSSAPCEGKEAAVSCKEEVPTVRYGKEATVAKCPKESHKKCPKNELQYIRPQEEYSLNDLKFDHKL